jgi:hypothetical protein
LDIVRESLNNANIPLGDSFSAASTPQTDMMSVDNRDSGLITNPSSKVDEDVANIMGQLTTLANKSSKPGSDLDGVHPHGLTSTFVR